MESTYVRRSLQRRSEKKAGFLAKTLDRCWSLGRRRRPRPTAPPGCFVVLVGPEKERFAVRAERANHPLFRALLDEAEAEYGFPRPSDEPLALPCAADEFLRVMSELEWDQEHEDTATPLSLSSSPAWSFFSKGFQRLSPGPALLELNHCR